MQRVTVTIDDDLLVFLDTFCGTQGYGSRSEAVRDLLRQAEADEHRKVGSDKSCVAALTYTYDHHSRNLTNRLTDSQHQRFDMSIATLHVHITHKDCLEVAVLRGKVSDIRAFADSVKAQKGVKHGHLHMIPALDETHDHS